MKLILPFYLNLGMVLISLTVLCYIAILGKRILAPMVFALLLSILLLPAAGRLERKGRLHQSLAAIVSVSGYTGDCH